MLQDPKWVPDLCMRIPMCGRFSLIFVGNSSSQWPRSPAQCHSQERWDGPLVNIEKTIENGPLIVDLPWFTYENSDVPVRKLLVYQRFIATKKLVKSDLKIGGSTQKMSRQNRFGNPKLRVLDENSRNQFWDAREKLDISIFLEGKHFFSSNRKPESGQRFSILSFWPGCDPQLVGILPASSTLFLCG